MSNMPGTVCSDPVCKNPSVSKGLCRTHYMQEYRKSLGKRMAPDYASIHLRVKRVNGPASDFFCEECDDRPANDWAYDHQDPMEMATDRLIYSTRVAHYRALCKTCHTRLDAENRPDEARRLRAQNRVLKYLLFLGTRIPQSWIPPWEDEERALFVDLYDRLKQDML